MQNIFKFVITILLASMLCGFSSNKTDDSVFAKALADPAITKEFQKFKEAAIHMPLEQKNGQPAFTAQDIKKLDGLSTNLIQLLIVHSELDPAIHKAHTYIGLNKKGSCYQFYNSLYPVSTGQDCVHFSKEFGSCELCDDFIDQVNSRPSNNIAHTHWWKHEHTISLINTAKLSNGDDVYIGFEMTPATILK